MSDAVVLSRISGGAIDGRLQFVRVRQSLFLSFHAALINRRNALLEATQADDRCTRAEAQAVFASALIELRNHYNLLDFEEDLELEYSLAMSKSDENKRTPIALTYVIPNPFNLLYSVVNVLSAALEAGSCVVTELEGTVKRAPALLREVITQSLDQEAFGVVSSRAPSEFLAQCVIVDQNPECNFSAKRVLLSPEYRSIAIVDRTGDTSLAAQEIVASRLVFGGASSYAVDLVLVNEFVEAEFQEELDQVLAETGLTERPPDDRSQTSRHIDLVDDTGDALLGREVKRGEAILIRGDSSKGVLQILDRSCPVGCRKLLGSRVIVYTTVTSLDDAIDFLSTEAQNATPVEALYLFAKSREGKYLSQYIESRATYVNHIPAELSVGPMAPRDYSTNLSIRYTREMFELPSPEIVPGVRTRLVSRLLEDADSFDQVAQKPLKPTGQPVSGAWGFFEQGLILGAIVYILPAMGLVTFGMGYAGWTGYRTWRTLK